MVPSQFPVATCISVRPDGLPELHMTATLHSSVAGLTLATEAICNRFFSVSTSVGSQFAIIL